MACRQAGECEEAFASLLQAVGNNAGAGAIARTLPAAATAMAGFETTPIKIDAGEHAARYLERRTAAADRSLGRP